MQPLENSDGTGGMPPPADMPALSRWLKLAGGTFEVPRAMVSNINPDEPLATTASQPNIYFTILKALAVLLFHQTGPQELYLVCRITTCQGQSLPEDDSDDSRAMKLRTAGSLRVAELTIEDDGSTVFGFFSPQPELTVATFRHQCGPDFTAESTTFKLEIEVVGPIHLDYQLVLDATIPEIGDAECTLAAMFDPQWLSRKELRSVLSDLEHVIWQLLKPGADQQMIQDFDTVGPLRQRSMHDENSQLAMQNADHVNSNHTSTMSKEAGADSECQTVARTPSVQGVLSDGIDGSSTSNTVTSGGCVTTFTPHSSSVADTEMCPESETDTTRSATPASTSVPSTVKEPEASLDILLKGQDIGPFSLLPSENAKPLREVIAEAAYQCEVKIDAIEDLYPCTEAQQQAVTKGAQDSQAAMGRFVFDLQNDDHCLDIDRFKEAWREVWQTSHILRTRFVRLCDTSNNELLLQAVVWKEQSWRTAGNLDAYIKSDKARPMLAGQSLSRFALIIDHNDGEPTHFVLTMHRMLYDPRTIELLVQQVNATYKGRPIPPSTNFKSFVAHTLARNQDQSSNKEFWGAIRRNRDSFSLLPPTVAPRKSPVKSFSVSVWVPQDGNRHAVSLDPKRVSTIVRLSWAISIAHFTKENDILFGEMLSGRNAELAGIEGVQGPTTTSSVPIRLRLSGDCSIPDSLDFVESYYRQLAPFQHSRLQAIEGDGSEMGQSLNYETMLDIQLRDAPRADGHEPLNYDPDSDGHRILSESCPFMCKIVVEGVRKIRFAVKTNPITVDPEFACKFISMVKSLTLDFINFSSDSNLKLKDVVKWPQPKETYMRPSAMLDLDGKQVDRWNLGDAQKRTIPDLIFDGRRADQQAIWSFHTSLSYSRLDQFSTALAIHLTNVYSVEKGELIPLILGRSILNPVVMLAVLKAGAAFVLTENPSGVSCHNLLILDQVRPRLVLATIEDPSYTYALTQRGGVTQLMVDITFLEKLPVGRLSQLPDVSVSSVAYVMFTETGQSKEPNLRGVMISHEAFSTGSIAFGSMISEGELQGRRRRRLLSPSVDVTQILTTLILGCGACLLTQSELDGPHPQATLELLTSCAVADWLTVSSKDILRGLVTTLKEHVKTMDIIIAGEPRLPVAKRELYRQNLRELSRWFRGRARIMHLYTTSYITSVGTTCQVSPATRSDFHSIFEDMDCIGKSIGCRAWVVDQVDHDQLISGYGRDEVGELVLEGPTLASGFWNEDKGIYSGFIWDPKWAQSEMEGSKVAGERRRMYKTGLLVYRKSDSENSPVVYVGSKS